MPVVRLRVDRLEKATGMDIESVKEALFKLKCESEEADGYLEVEVMPDRPDMFITEGVARAVKGVMGVETGWRAPEVVDTRYRLVVEDVPTRPYIAGAILYNVNVDEDLLEDLIQFQEKLHETLGRRRAKAAIGLHDLSKMESEVIRYKLEPLSTRFNPLDVEGEMSIGEYLSGTEKGSKYGGLALDRGSERHPALYSGSSIISVPPVINARATMVEPGTRDLFIDVTGTSSKLVSEILDIIVSTLSERPGVRVGRVQVVGNSPWSKTPLLRTSVLSLKTSEVNSMLGIRVEGPRIADALERMRYRASYLDIDDVVSAVVPPFRIDVIDRVDLVEDVAIALGYESIIGKRLARPERGSMLKEVAVYRRAAEILVGMGFTEVMQLTLTSPKLVSALGMEDQVVRVANPVQLEYSVLRPSIMVTLLGTLYYNQHKEKPVKVFEAGRVVYWSGEKIAEDYRLGMAILDDEVGYEDIQANVYALLRILGVDFSVEEASHPALIEGRTAAIKIGGSRAGFIGEVKPSVLEELGIGYPVAIAEFSLEVASKWRFKT